MRTISFLCFFFLIHLFGFSQSTSYPIKLVDATSQEAIANAQVLNEVGELVALSDSKGLVTLYPKDGFRFEILKDGYYIHSLEIDWIQVRSTEPRILELRKSSFDLKEATVSADRVKITDTTRIVDYTFLGEQVLLLGYEYLVLTDTTFEPAIRIKNTKEFTRIEEDVRGYTFLFFEDSVHQVALLDSKLYFYPAFEIGQYNAYLKPLEAVWDSVYIMRNCWPEVVPLPVSEMRPGNKGKAITHAPFHNKGVQYLAYEKGRAPREAYVSIDTAAIIVAQDAFTEYYSIAAGIEAQFDQMGIFNHTQLFELDVARKTYEQFYASFMPFPLFADSTQLIVFDHIKEKVQLLDKDFQVIKCFPFSFGKKVVPPAIIRDGINNDFYQVEKHNGLIKLVILNNFKPGSSYALDLFADEIKVRDGRAWYLNENDRLTFKNITFSPL